MSSDAPQNKYKRKRKKTFLKNARKYAKQGYYGRGSHMDADTYQYFVRILEAFKQGFDNEEDKAAFVDNVFQQTENKETECSCNQVGCRVIETLLPFASDRVLERFINVFSEDLRPLSKDRFASFVLQALVSISCRKSFMADQKPLYKNFAIKVSKFLLNNLEDYMWDNFGNRVMRTCLCELMQISEKDINFAKSEEYQDVVKDYGQRLIAWPQFNELVTSELTSGFLQVLLKALQRADVKLLKKYLENLLNESFSANENNMPRGFMSMSQLMLLETALQVASKKMLNLYCERLFKGRMVQLACLRSTNFAVQKVLNHCSNKELFDALFDELGGHFEEIINKGHGGVLLALCQACKRLSSKQSLFVQNIIESLNCNDQEDRQKELTLSICRLKSYDPKNPFSNNNLAKDKLNLQGTLMLQLMLDFNKPIKMVNGILSMDSLDLKNLFSNTMGSHIVDSFVKSGFVGEKNREKLVRKMTGTYQDLASCKYGSRSFEALWNAANMKSKYKIMEELIHKEGSWSNSEFGRIIASKVDLVLFKRSRENWKNSFNRTLQPQEALADVLK